MEWNGYGCDISMHGTTAFTAAVEVKFEPTEVPRPFHLHVYDLELLKGKVPVHVTITCDALSSTV